MTHAARLTQKRLEGVSPEMAAMIKRGSHVPSDKDKAVVAQTLIQLEEEINRCRVFIGMIGNEGCDDPGEAAREFLMPKMIAKEGDGDDINTQAKRNVSGRTSEG